MGNDLSDFVLSCNKVSGAASDSRQFDGRAAATKAAFTLHEEIAE